ncbi:hypothetical protein A5789_30750 [Nocardia sp. 852002-51101_SCH5132738]|nr:hypothetical protein A5789_30750 [Nocardia sp. 852002-51101_SCH5132738]
MAPGLEVLGSPHAGSQEFFDPFVFFFGVVRDVPRAAVQLFALELPSGLRTVDLAVFDKALRTAGLVRAVNLAVWR